MGTNLIYGLFVLGCKLPAVWVPNISKLLQVIRTDVLQKKINLWTVYMKILLKHCRLQCNAMQCHGLTTEQDAIRAVK
jgi:hypothetical protein